MTIKGIDVSSYQSETPNLKGFDFCFVKATEGTSYINPRMAEQAAHARGLGLIVGFYHYLQPGDMRAQARYFVEKCTSIEGDPLWCDWEETRVSCADKDRFIKEVIRLRGSAHQVGLYCNRDFWLHRDTTSYCGNALWIANYNGRPGDPGIQHKWLFHQYTSSPVDTNISTFASRAALKAWCRAGQEMPAKPPEKEESVSFDLDTNLSVNDWIKKRWPNDGPLQNGIWVSTALSSGYGHARRAGDAGEAALAEVKALRAEVADLKKTLSVLDPAKLAADLEKVIESAKLRFEVPDA